MRPLYFIVHQGYFRPEYTRNGGETTSFILHPHTFLRYKLLGIRVRIVIMLCFNTKVAKKKRVLKQVEGRCGHFFFVNKKDVTCCVCVFFFFFFFCLLAD